jgi:hypothetical protein
MAKLFALQARPIEDDHKSSQKLSAASVTNKKHTSSSKVESTDPPRAQSKPSTISKQRDSKKKVDKVIVKPAKEVAKTTSQRGKEQPKQTHKHVSHAPSPKSTQKTCTQEHSSTSNNDSALHKNQSVDPQKDQNVILEQKKIDEIETVHQDSSSNEGTLISPSATSSTNRMMTPMSRKEKETIDLLQQNIEAQERRLEEIENERIPSLHRAAKSFLKQKNKAEALKCVAHKKRLENQVDVIKSAIFNMETQMFKLENAMEDRYVKKALDEAASAISGLLGDSAVDLTDMNESLLSAGGVVESDEDLLDELNEWVSPEGRQKKRTEQDDDVSILSLPTIPSTNPYLDSSSSSVDKRMEAVLGS